MLGLRGVSTNLVTFARSVVARVQGEHGFMAVAVPAAISGRGGGGRFMSANASAEVERPVTLIVEPSSQKSESPPVCLLLLSRAPL